MGKISVLLTRKFLPSWKEFPLGGFLGVLCVLAVNADTQFNRQVAKYAKKTPSKAIWLRLVRDVYDTTINPPKQTATPHERHVGQDTLTS